MIRTIEVARAQRRAKIVTTGSLVAMLLSLPLPLPGDAQAVGPTTIGSQAVVGTPVLTAAASVLPDPIASDTAVHAPTIAAGAAAIAVPAMAAGGIVASPVVALVPAQVIVVGAIAATSAVRSPAIGEQGAATIAPAPLAGSSIVRAPAVVPGAVSLAPAGITSAGIVPAPAVIINPAPFAFVQDTNITPGQMRLSNEITLDMSGSTVPVTVSVSGAPGSVIWKNGVDIGAGPTTGIHADRFRVGHAASNAYSTVTSTTLTAGTTSASYTSTTKSEVVASYDPATTAALDAMFVQPTEERALRYDALIKGLKADGVWALLDWLALIAAHDAQAGRLNLINPAQTLSLFNAPTFTVDRGYSGDGSSSYLSPMHPWAGGSRKFARDSATLAVWVNLAGSGTQTVPIGIVGSNNSQLIMNSTGTATVRLNTSTNVGIADPAPRAAHRAMVRSDGANVSLYTNGQLVATAANTSATPSNADGSILRGSGSYTDGRVAAFYSGSAMMATQIAAINNRLSTFLTPIGAA